MEFIAGEIVCEILHKYYIGYLFEKLMKNENEEINYE
jgi:hypothetical protein